MEDHSLAYVAKEDMDQWRQDCMKWRGRILTGASSHWCWDWDGLPIDETCPEYPCACFREKVTEI